MDTIVQTNPKISAIVSEGFETAEKHLVHTLRQIAEVDGKNGTNMVYAASVIAGSALNYLAHAIAKGDTAAEKAEAGKECMLVAALIAGRVVLPNRDTVRVEFHPRNVLAAIEAAKVVSGCEIIEDYLNDGMIACFREGCQENGITEMGYWDCLREVGPDFGDLAEGLRSVVKH